MEPKSNKGKIITFSLFKNIKFNYRDKWIFISMLIWGFVAHGFMFLNKISYHDDVFNVHTHGGGIIVGRWGGYYLDMILTRIFGQFPSNSLFNGMLSILFMAISLDLISRMFHYKDKRGLFLLSGISIAAPTITSIFGFGFLSYTYCFGLFLCILGTYMISEGKFIIKGFGIVVFVLSIGIYQAFIPTALTIALLKYTEMVSKNEMSIFEFIKSGLSIILCFAFASIVYFFMTNITLAINHAELSNYKNIATMGKDGLFTYISRIPLTYRFLICPDDSKLCDMFPLNTRILYYICLCLCVFIAISCIIYSKHSKKKCIELIVLFLLFPVAINFIYIMCDYKKTTVEVITQYAYIAVFFVSIIGLDMLKHIKLKKYVFAIAAVSVLFTTLIFCRYSNMCYTKLYILQEQAKAYFTSLVCAIQNVEGYNDTYPVVFIHENEKNTNYIGKITGFDDVTISPFDVDTLINDFAWREFMKMWCGYNPISIRDYDGSYTNDGYISHMPSYPNAGSIQVIDGTIIVQFLGFS